MKIGRVLNYGNPGERISVQLLDGKIVNAIAGNVINSTQVLVAGGYCWSSNSPVEQTKDRYVFRTKGTPKKEEEACQLVAATVLQGYVDLRDINTIPPYDIAPNTSRAIIPENPSWKYNSQTDVCELFDDGSGQYDSLQSCFAANKTGVPNRAMYIANKRSISCNFEFEVEDFENLRFPQNSSSIFDQFLKGDIDSTPSETPSETFFGTRKTYYSESSNGDIILNNFGFFGLDIYNTYQLAVLIRRSLFLDSLSELGDDAWLYAKFVRKIGDSFQTIVVTAFYFDGSLIEIKDGQETPINASGFSCNGKTCRKTYPGIYNSDNIREAYGKYGYKVVFPLPFVKDDNGAISYPSDYYLIELKISLGLSLIVLRDTTLRYKMHFSINSILIKFHDPNLPLIKGFEYDSKKSIESSFIFLGNKSYLINKLEKIQVPEIPFEERPWFKVVVVELTIERSADDYIVTKQKYDYYNPQGFVTNSKNVLRFVTDRYETNPSELVCFNGNYDFSKNFVEVAYQKLEDGTIIEFKIPGRIFFND